MERRQVFEARLRALESELRQGQAARISEVVVQSQLEGEERERLTATLEQTFFLRNAAGQCAVDAQKWVRRMDRVSAFLTVSATAFGALALTYLPGSVSMAALESACALGLLLLVLLPKRRDVHDRWTRSRYLAELGRVARYCMPAGVDPCQMAREADGYLPADRPPSHWLLEVLAERLAVVPMPTERGASAAMASWVADFLDQQAGFHEKTAKRREAALGLTRWIGASCFVLALVLTSLSTLSAAGMLSLGAGLSSFIQFIALLLPVVAASTFLLSVQKEDRRIAGRSRRMAGVLRREAKKLHVATDDLARFQAIETSARHMILEAYEWSTLMETAAES